MIVRTTRTAACVVAVVLSVFLLVDSPHAQGKCSQALDQGLSKIREFDAEAKRQALDFVVDGTVDAAFTDGKKLLADKMVPTSATVKQVETYKAKIESWESVQKTFAITMDDLTKCLMPGSRGGCLTDIIGRQNEAFKRWIQSMLSEGTQTALERATKARDLLQNNVKQLSSNAIGSINAAVGCMDQYVKAGAAAEPVDPRNPPPGGGAAPPTGGGASIGKTVAVVTVLGAGGYAAYAVAQQLAAAKSSNNDTGSSLFAGAQQGFSCSPPGATNNLRTCSGTMVVRTAPPLTQGAVYLISTVPSTFHGSFTAGASGGIVNAIAVTTQTGSGCLPTQTEATFSPQNNINVSIASTPVSIPVQCQ